MTTVLTDPLPISVLLRHTMLALAICLGPLEGAAQSANPPATAPITEETIELSPFIVNTSQDSGYSAKNTLSGTRLNTSLRDTAGAMSVITDEFLKDIGATTLESALTYTPNFNPYLGNTIDVAAQHADAGRFNANLVVIRGITTNASSRDFFPTLIPQDFYGAERITVSRGPNSLLFGVGDPAGVIVNGTKKAQLFKSTHEVQARYDDHASKRVSLDVNQPLVAGRFALRLNLLHDDYRQDRDNEGRMQDRAMLALTARPFAKTTVRANYENYDLGYNWVPLRYGFDGGILQWRQKGSALVSYVPNGTAGSGGRPAQTQFDPQRGLSFQGSSRLESWGNLPGLNQPFDTRYLGLVGTAGAGNDVIAGVPISYVHVPNPEAYYGIPFHQNMYLGTRPYPARALNGGVVGLFVEQQVGRDLFFEFAFNRERNTEEVTQFGQDILHIDPNQFLPSGASNPGYRRIYGDGFPSYRGGWWLQQDYRATVSYELDLRQRAKWLGHHRFAGLWQSDELEQRKNVYQIVNTIANGLNGLSTVPAATVHRLFWRTYYNTDGSTVEPTNFRQLIHEDRLGELTVRNLDGSKRFEFARRNINSPLMGLTKTQSQLGAWQGYWWNDRLVTTAGLRRDTVRNYALAPVVMDADGYFSDISAQSFNSTPQSNVTGATRTLAAVAHVTSWLSPFVNTSENFVPAEAVARDYLGKPLPNGTGHTLDLGVKIRLIQDKLDLEILHYSANKKNQGENPTFRTDLNALWDDLHNLQTQGIYTFKQKVPANAELPTQLTENRDTLDVETRGWESNLVYNPARTWRMTANFSLNETKSANIYPTLRTLIPQLNAQFAAYRAELAAEVARITAGGGTTNVAALNNSMTNIDTRTANMARTLADKLSTQGQFLSRPGKRSANFISRYALPPMGRLRGLAVGTTAQWRSAPIIGYQRDAASQLRYDQRLYGKAYFQMGAFVTYQCQLRQKTSLDLQLNVDNLLDQHDLRPAAADIDTAGYFGPAGQVAVYRWDMQRPRTYRLTATVRF